MMRRILLLAPLVAVLGILHSRSAAAAPAPSISTQSAGEVLCIPDVYAPTPVGCERQGPDAYMARMTSAGLRLPLQPLPASPPPFDLTYVEFNYAQVVKGNAPIYPSLERAVKKGNPNRRMESGFDYISYIEIQEVNGHKYFQLRSGEWMYGGDLSRISVPRFQGLEMHATPARPFGWILHPTETKRTPGYATQDYTGHRLNRYDQVQIYAVETIEEIEWYLVGPDEWVEQRLLGQVLPSSDPPQGVDNGRWIEINLFEQTISVYERGQMVYATLISSGLPGWWTRPGLFPINIKLHSDTMRGAFEPDRSDYYYLEDVPWTMYFDEARALHGAYWHNGFGYARSHGCVNLAPGDAQWIFDWAQDGDWVYVWDPSGKTPVDPDLYSAGGA